MGVGRIKGPDYLGVTGNRDHASGSAVSDRCRYRTIVGGEVRQAAQTSRRLHEAARLGYRLAIVAESAPEVDGVDLVRVETLSDALLAAGMLAS